MQSIHASRDDGPETFSLSRRKLVIGGALLAGAASIFSEVSAQSLSAPSLAASPNFMEVSSLLINHRLDPEIGARMAQAMLHKNPEIERDIDAIIEIAKRKNARIVEDFFPDIPDGRVKEAALAIISAWYTGVVDQTPDAEVFAFEMALMYQPTRDVMTIPSYAISAPNAWSAEAPPLSDMPTF